MNSFYLDSSAIIKRVRDEEHSAALVDRLRSLSKSGHATITSALTWVEVERSLRSIVARAGALDTYPLDDAVATATIDIGIVRITAPVLAAARWIGPPILRSLDAIHLASAVLGGASVFITYDQRLAEAARSVKLAVESPM